MALTQQGDIPETGRHQLDMPAITEATAKALSEFPQVNASVNGYQIILKKHINVGIAVSLDDGNLIVPVVRDADKLNLNGLAVAIDTLANKARDNKLAPDDIQEAPSQSRTSVHSRTCSLHQSSTNHRLPSWESVI